MAPLRGPITERSVYYFVNRLLYLAAESPKEPILMEVTSEGGLIPQSLEIMRIMDSVSCAINTLCRGTVRGTSVVIAAHGARGFRTALANCRFTLSLDNANAVSAGPGSEPMTKLLGILARDGAKGKDQVLKWVESGVEFGAQEALAAGLIDFITALPVKAGGAPVLRP